MTALDVIGLSAPLAGAWLLVIIIREAKRAGGERER